MIRNEQFTVSHHNIYTLELNTEHFFFGGGGGSTTQHEELSLPGTELVSPAVEVWS